jgi:hypothetical protein
MQIVRALPRQDVSGWLVSETNCPLSVLSRKVKGTTTRVRADDAPPEDYRALRQSGHDPENYQCQSVCGDDPNRYATPYTGVVIIVQEFE